MYIYLYMYLHGVISVLIVTTQSVTGSRQWYVITIYCDVTAPVQYVLSLAYVPILYIASVILLSTSLFC